MMKKEISGCLASRPPWGEAGCTEALSPLMLMLPFLKLCYMLIMPTYNACAKLQDGCLYSPSRLEGARVLRNAPLSE